MNYWPKRVFQAGIWALLALVNATVGYERYIEGYGWWSLLFVLLATASCWNSYRAIRGYVYWYGNPKDGKAFTSKPIIAGNTGEIRVDTGLENLSLIYEVELVNAYEEEK